MISNCLSERKNKSVNLMSNLENLRVKMRRCAYQNTPDLPLQIVLCGWINFS